jgi:DNA repair protein RecO (recombination protein O)
VIHKTRGVVLSFTRYGESSIIVSIFTELFGVQSYIANGIRSQKSKSKMALFQPLTLLELVVYHREHANINRLKEVKCFHPYQSIQSDIIKSTVAMFVGEVLYKTLRNESHPQPLGEFIITSLITLDTLTSNAENFHLIFLLKLSRFLGFGAQTVNEILGWRVTDPLIEELLEKILRADYTTNLSVTNVQRREILDLLVKYWNDHTGMLADMKSIQVLRDVLS